MKRYRSYGVCAAFVIALVVCFLRAWGVVGFTSWHVIRDLLIGFAVLVLAQGVLREDLRQRIWYGSYVLFLVWMLVFPVILVLSAKGWTVNFGDMASYYKSSLFLSIAAAFLLALGRHFPKGRWLAVAVYGTAAGVLSLIAFVYAGYYGIYHIAFAAGDMLPVVQTSWKEAEGFLLQYAGMGRIAAAVLGFLVYWAVCGELASYGMKGREDDPAWPRWKAPLLLGLMAILLIQASGQLKEGFPFYEYRVAKEYINSVKVAERVHAEHAMAFHLDSGAVPLPQKAPGTVLVVIGESENRDHMRAFQPRYPVETTPWLSSVQEKEGFFLFRNAYANYPQTAQSLGMFLAGVNQYNGKRLADVVSLVDVAKAAGYTTWWVSNQDKMEDSDRHDPTAMIAGWADHERRTLPSMGDDIRLLDFLKDIPPEGNHFIILHLMGSHSRYAERVPKDFPQLHTVGRDRQVDAYDTTVLYTDHVLREIFEYARDHLHLQAMVYASDHGEDMKLGHSAGVFSFDMVRIPLFVYLSPEYRALYPETGRQLALHRSAVFTNDLMFDTVSGLIQAPHGEYEARWDLSSDRYDLPLAQAVTKHGEVWISEDAEWIERSEDAK